MPTNANQEGRHMANPDTTNIDRLATPENTGLQNSETATKSGGIQTPPQVPNGRHIANAEAVSGQGAPGTRQYLVSMAEAWRAAGCRVHPARADGSKVPVSVDGGGVGTYPATFPDTYPSGPRAGQPHPRAGQPDPKAGQHNFGWKRLGTGELVYPWPGVLSLLRSRHDGIGVFCGAVSGNLEMVELEGRAVHLVAVLEQTAAERGQTELWERFNNGCSETTPAGGIHWYLRVAGGGVPGNTKLAMRPNPADPSKPLVFAETRGTGGWVVVAGSFGRTHASGKPYALRTGSPAGIPTFTPDEHAAIHALFRTLDEMPEFTLPEKATGTATLTKRERPEGQLFPGDDFDQRGSWSEVFPPGWARLSQGSHADAWSMHGAGGRKTADHYHGNDRLFIYDTECPGAQKSLTKFSAYAWLNHNGDFGAAAAALYANNYGTRLEKKKAGADKQEQPPARLETIAPAPVVELAQLRGTLRDQLRAVAITKPAVAVVTSGTSVGKSFAAAEILAPAFDRVVFNVATHDAAAAMVERLQAAGHTDAVAFPPLNENTCPGWTADDAKRLADEHGQQWPAVGMERALRVGVPALACSRCPLSPTFKRPPAPQPDMAFAAFAPADEPGTLAEFSDPWAEPEPDAANTEQIRNLTPEPVECRCPFWRQRQAWEASNHPVQCHERTRRNAAAIKPLCGETVALVTDEHAAENTTPHDIISANDLRAVAESVKAAAANERNRVAKMRFSKTREQSHLVAVWADTVAGVADGMADHMDNLAAAGTPGATPLQWPAADTLTRPKRANNKLAELLARADLPERFSQAAFEVARRAAMGQLGWLPGERVTVFVSVDGGGKAFAHLHRSWRLDFHGVCHVILDAHADVEGIRNAFPDAVVFAPPGEAPRVHDARQWWQEINPSTHPAKVVEAIEQALDWAGWQRPALLLPKRHRNVLFPQTRPRGARPATDKPVDVEAIANWNTGRRAIGADTLPQRMEAARAIAARVEAIRARLARDEHGNAFVEHLRGTKSRGSNKFIDNTDGVLVVGHTRCNPGKIVAHLLATGRGQAVADCPTGDWVTRGVEGELPTTDGGTRTVRWSGYKHPEWAEAARFVNRADLEQTLDRARTRLDTGKPVLVVAAEPCGLPLAEPPARLPAGVARVVDAVRTLTGGPKVVPPCEDGQNHAGGETGKRCIGHAKTAAGSLRRPCIGSTPEGAQIATAHGGESGHRCIEHNNSPILLHAWPDSPGVSQPAIVAAVGLPERTVKRWLAEAVDRGVLVRTGAARATRYAVPVPGQVENHPRPLVLEPATVPEPGNDLERANAMLDEAATIDEPGDGIPEPTPRRPSRATPNAPNAPTAPRKRWLPMRTPGQPRAPQPAVLAALAAERDRIRANPDWNAPETWAAVRDAIPPNDARAETERVEAALPPRFRAVRRE
jgi:hypothetical protein